MLRPLGKISVGANSYPVVSIECMSHDFPGESILYPRLSILLAVIFFFAMYSSQADSVDDYVNSQMKRQHVVGAIKSFVPDWKSETGSARDFGYRAVFEKESVNFSVSVEADDKISRIQIEIE